MKSSTTKLDTVAIIGVGLIGGSVARALKQARPSTAILAVDREAKLPALEKSKLFDAVEGIKDAAKPLARADVVILCAPHGENIKWLPRLRKILRKGAIVTDVGGIKRDICDSALELFTGAGSATFIGGHPMAGSEQAGFENSRADLFKGRPWALTPVSKSHPSKLGLIAQLVTLMGAQPRVMTPAAHDETIVTVSHLPQLVSVALMLTAKGRDRGLAGPGLLGMTRLAASSPEVWDPLLAAERQRSIGELQRLRAYLTELEISLAFNEPLERWFDLAGNARRELERGPKRRS
ncbi:MAG: prephenate dehydrogenase/arogenate dehydrogenase family protein [Planctomycetes bacterium]|nr:prephenate dehydrogenase/arogenate dehydrogenase family protein [Planctomycetota bacterium]